MNDAKTPLQRQRNPMRISHALDGGGTVAADKEGDVYVAWHGAGEQKGEEHRRVWLARSTDDGRTFARETALTNETGACGCCGMRAFVDPRGALHLFYRTATNMTERGMFLLTSIDKGKSFQGKRLDNWSLTSCPMSSVTAAANDKQTLAAWENDGQVYFGAIDLSSPKPVAAP